MDLVRDAAAVPLAALHGLERVAPRAADRLVWRMFCYPGRTTRRRQHRDAQRLTRQGEWEPITVPRRQARDLPGYATGPKAGPRVWLIHGWGGRAAQLSALAFPFAAVGFRVSAVDLPGHGGAPTWQTNGFHLADGMRDWAAAEGGPPDAMVAHSFGALIAGLTFEEQPPRASVLLAPALDLVSPVDRFAELLRLRPRTRDALQRRLEAIVDGRWGGLASGGHLRWPGSGPVLAVHDPDDPETPYALSAELARTREDVRLMTTPGLGHVKLMHDPAVVSEATSFLAAALGTQDRLDDAPPAPLGDTT